MKNEPLFQYVKSVFLPPLAEFFRRKKDRFCAEKVFFIILILSFFAVIAAMMFTMLDRRKGSRT